MNSFDGYEAALSAQIRVELAERSMDQKGLAEKVGVHAVTLSKYMQGQRTFPIRVVLDIAGAFEISPRELMERVEKRLAQ